MSCRLMCWPRSIPMASTPWPRTTWTGGRPMKRVRAAAAHPGRRGVGSRSTTDAYRCFKVIVHAYARRH